MAELHLEQLVNQQLAQVKQLLQILTDEKEILQQQDPNALIAVTDKKQAVLTAIETTEQQIKQTPDHQAQITDASIASIIADIEATLTQCKDLNNVNGAIIEQSSLAIERMQSSLLESRSKSSMTYDNKGKKSGGLMGKSIKA